MRALLLKLEDTHLPTLSSITKRLRNKVSRSLRSITNLGMGWLLLWAFDLVLIVDVLANDARLSVDMIVYLSQLVR